MNPLEDPANDLGGPGGQELYPASMAFQKRVFVYDGDEMRRMERLTVAQEIRVAGRAGGYSLRGDYVHCEEVAVGRDGSECGACVG